MNRVILEACFPCMIALILGFAALLVLCKLSRAKWDWQRLRQLHRCEHGGVQSLAFVLTLPVFLMIVLFIVQVSQLMIALVVVHYSAFAGARAASVWLPAQMVPETDIDEADDFAEVENRLSQPPTATENDYLTRYQLTAQDTSPKLIQVRKAVLMACMPMCPSRNLGYQPISADIANTISTYQQMYGLMVPSSQQNPKIPARIANKLAYADNNTAIELKWFDSSDPQGVDSRNYRSYNPRNHPNPEVIFRPNEIGWQDPITITVVHQFVLLPGPGRFLSTALVNPQTGGPNAVSSMIQRDVNNSSYVIAVTGSATITPEGIKSVRPYVQNP